MAEKKIFAVVGDPVLHSRSPQIFRSGYEGTVPTHSFTRLSISSAADAIKVLTEVPFDGMNITAPFKESILPFIDRIDSNARAIGAVNTIVKTETGVSGFNTDHQGVALTFRKAGIPLAGANCVVLGAGGAGRAAAYALTRENAKVAIVNRNMEKGRAAARAAGCTYFPMGSLKSLLHQADILVSTLPAGSNLAAGIEFDRPIAVLNADYTDETLTDRARECGCRVLEGGEWLINQAIPAFEMFTGEYPSEDAMRKALENKNSGRTNISLIGFMGCGKTTVGRILAEMTGRKFTDIDSEIEIRERCMVNDIFKSWGESGFREIEKEMLYQIVPADNQVIACGGGIVLKEDNIEALRKNSIVIWLYCDLTTCLERCSDGLRPLLNNQNLQSDAEKMLKERIHHYASSADLVIDNTQSPGEAAERIAYEIGKAIEC